MDTCIHHDATATHLLARPHRYGVDYLPLCEDCADDCRPEYLTPITHYACHICEREIEREHPEPPICEYCERTARAAGKSANDANRYPNPPRF